ncbi:MAG: YggS family pyridoxal phosphate-dependent enzyme [Actinomycetota bacterium]|nr:YggS family pyridoxal phosphate-dependent enzyme [Actinomycetota bacterium]
MVDACAAVARDPRSITLIAVTKTYPASDAATLVGLGLLDLGESRDQEAVAKAAELASLLRRSVEVPVPRWHFVGRLQSRKARSVARYAHSVHSVDRTELIEGLADAVGRLGRSPLEVFIQVSLDGDPNRGGAVIGGLGALADAVSQRQELRLRGVMAVAPLGGDPDEAFSRLAEASALVCSQHPDAVAISAGMSADLEQAVKHGSTHLRVGSALLGRRREVFG